MSDDEKVELHRDSKGRLKGDDAPPQNTIIFVAAIGSILTLFSLRFAFDSYLDASNLNVRHTHVTESHASEVLAEYRTHAQDQLREGEMPIGDAMDQLATRGRAAFAPIRPIADTSTAAREGWAAMPVVAGEPAPHAQAIPADEEPEVPAAPADAVEAPAAP